MNEKNLSDNSIDLFQLLKFEQITIFYGAFLSLAMIGSIVQFLSTRRDE